jgi:glycolate oxidase
VACTVGGNIAENSGGPHTLKYGVTVNHIISVEMVLPDGEIVWLGGPGDSSALDLVGIVVGSEGTFGIVTRAWVRLVRTAPAVRTMLGIFPTVDAATECVSSLIAAGIVPAALEMMDQLVVHAVEAAFHFGFPLDAGAVLIIELDGLPAALGRLADEARAIAMANGAREVRTAKDEAERAALWAARKRAIGAAGRLAPSNMTQDGVIPRSKLPEVLREIGAIGRKYGIKVANVFHAGDGNLHPCVLFDERDPDEVKRVIEAGHEILDLCLSVGGSITGEHGVGVEKLDHMPRMFDAPTLELMAEIRRAFNPDGRCNPGKLLPTHKSCVELTMKKRRSVAL